MKKILIVILAAMTALMAGCASDRKQTSATYHPAPFSEVTIPDDPPAKPPGTLPPKLSESECRDVAETADRLAHRGLNAGPPWPPPIHRLKPIEVYSDRGNIVIALYRDEREERGFYYQPGISSHNREANSAEWSWMALPHGLYEYRRTKQAR